MSLGILRCATESVFLNPGINKKSPDSKLIVTFTSISINLNFNKDPENSIGEIVFIEASLQSQDDIKLLVYFKNSLLIEIIS